MHAVGDFAEQSAEKEWKESMSGFRAKARKTLTFQRMPAESFLVSAAFLLFQLLYVFLLGHT